MLVFLPFLLNSLCFSFVLSCFLPELRIHPWFCTGLSGGTVLSRVEAGCSQHLVERLAMLINKPSSKRDLCPHASSAEAETPWVGPQETSSDPQSTCSKPSVTWGTLPCVYQISLTLCLPNLYVCLKYKLICKIDTIFYHFGKFCNLQKYYSTGCIVHQGERGGRGVDSSCFLVEVSVELGSGNLLTEKGQMVWLVQLKF